MSEYLRRLRGHPPSAGGAIADLVPAVLPTRSPRRCARRRAGRPISATSTPPRARARGAGEASGAAQVGARADAEGQPAFFTAAPARTGRTFSRACSLAGADPRGRKGEGPTRGARARGPVRPGRVSAPGDAWLLNTFFLSPHNRRLHHGFRARVRSARTVISPPARPNTDAQLDLIEGPCAPSPMPARAGLPSRSCSDAAAEKGRRTPPPIRKRSSPARPSRKSLQRSSLALEIVSRGSLYATADLGFFAYDDRAGEGHGAENEGRHPRRSSARHRHLRSRRGEGGRGRVHPPRARAIR